MDSYGKISATLSLVPRAIHVRHLNGKHVERLRLRNSANITPQRGALRGYYSVPRAIALNVDEDPRN